MRILLKVLGTIPLLLFYIVMAGIIRLFPGFRKMKRAAVIRIGSVFARLFLVLFRIRVRVKHRERLHTTDGARLIVSNHLSYIDVLIMSSLVPSVFITSVELKNTALLGMLARLSGSIFVERRKPSGLKREIEDIASALGQGVPVSLFPEGTTSNGDCVQPFKNSLFDAAVLTGASILPICLRYTRVNNERLTPENRDTVFYYGGVTFATHFLRFLSIKSVNVEVIPLKVIPAHPQQSRKDLATETHKAIRAEYHGGKSVP